MSMSDIKQYASDKQRQIIYPFRCLNYNFAELNLHRFNQRKFDNFEVGG